MTSHSTIDEPALDTSAVKPARRYNYWLGGKDNFAADRDSGDAIAQLFPGIVVAARQNFYFSGRAVRYLAERRGVDQFLDIGPGLPFYQHTHDIAQRANASSRVVYVDNDNLVMVHARALFVSTPEGRVAYHDADLRAPHDILTADALTGTLDLSRPVGLVLTAVLHFLPDEHAYSSVRTLLDALAPGSFLVLSHASYDLLDDVTRTKLASADYPGKGDFISRTRNQIADFFTGLDLVDPGLTVVSRWCPDTGSPPPDDQVAVYGGVAIKPGRPS